MKCKQNNKQKKLQQIHLFFVTGTWNCQMALYCVGVVPRALYSSFSPYSLCIWPTPLYVLYVLMCTIWCFTNAHPLPEHPTPPASLRSVRMPCDDALFSKLVKMEEEWNQRLWKLIRTDSELPVPPCAVPPSLLLIFKSIRYWLFYSVYKRLTAGYRKVADWGLC